MNKLLILLLLLFSSCSKEEKYTEIQLWKMATSLEKDIELVVVKEHEPHRRIVCENYGPGCVPGSGRRIKVRLVELIAVQFETTEQAKAEATKINQYYARNWVFDDARGEPVLEDFVVKAFDAKLPVSKKGDQ